MHRHLMKVFVSLDLPYDRYLPQSCVTFHYKRRRRPYIAMRSAGRRGGSAAPSQSAAAPHQAPAWALPRGGMRGVGGRVGTQS
jgi:hypothetical protein